MSRYYDSIKDKICERGCGHRITWRGKIPDKKGSTGWFEFDYPHEEHTYKSCDDMIKVIKEKSKHGELFPEC